VALEVSLKDIHSYANGSAFSKALTNATGKHYGTAAPLYLAKLVEHQDKVANWIRKAQRELRTLTLMRALTGKRIERHYAAP